MRLRPLILGLLTSAAAGAMASSALADPPGLVGRLSYAEGDVSMRPPQDDSWTDATRNYPVGPGESYWTGDDGRAELQIGPVEVRLDNQTELDVLDLDYGDMRLALPQGSMDLRLWSLPRGGVTVSTPAGEIHILNAGIYRVDVGAPPDDGSYPAVELTVLQGSADAPSSRGYTTVSEGDGALIYADYDPEFQDAQDASIDDWARDRESQENWRLRGDDSADMTGVEDLDRYGDFANDADYGQVWYPRNVPADWAPYRYGHWAFVNPWGWTWIDDQSWGFAPFHYGRWARIGDRWGWVRGQAEAEPVYAPALVAFIGGGGWSLSIGVQGMGWVPLAPEEVYRPTYRVSDDYLRHVNTGNVRPTTINSITVNNVTNVTVNNYRNAPAATVVRADTFTRGASVQKAVVAVQPADLARAHLTTDADRPAPTPEARAGGADKQSSGRHIPAGQPAAAPPPKLQAVHQAIAAQAPGSGQPPVIPGARPTPPKPRDPNGPATTFVAPSQIRHPDKQAQKALPAANAPPASGQPGSPGPGRSGRMNGNQGSPGQTAAPPGQTAGPGQGAADAGNGQSGRGRGRNFGTPENQPGSPAGQAAAPTDASAQARKDARDAAKTAGQNQGPQPDQASPPRPGQGEARRARQQDQNGAQGVAGAPLQGPQQTQSPKTGDKPHGTAAPQAGPADQSTAAQDADAKARKQDEKKRKAAQDTAGQPQPQ